MSLKVKCPGCTKTLTVPDAARGKAIKCPSCETRVAVPKDDAPSLAGKSSGTSNKPAKKARPVEDESGLASLDLRKVADHEANVCPKCGYDMDLLEHEEDEVITECPQCGWDIAEGGMGEKARKRALKGPDPDKFYQGLWKNSWKFTKENYFLAFRTYGYTMAASLIMFLSIFMYLWVSMWPPRYFFAFVTFVTSMVIPGWFWYLDTEVIKLTLERRDKFKRLHFDFFLASALGVKFVIWNLVFAGPLLLVPGIVGWALWHFGGLPIWVGIAIVAVCYTPIFALWPVALTHMTMPIESPAWMFWKVIPIGMRCFKPLFTWFLQFTVVNIPVLLIAGLTLFFTADTLVEYVEIMESKGNFNRVKNDFDEHSGSKNRPKWLIDPKTLTEIALKDATTMGAWLKQQGDEIHLGDALFEYKAKENTNVYRSTLRGVLEKATIQPGTPLTEASVIGTLKPHELEFKHELAITIGMMSWLVSGLILAFTSLISMRANGYFAYYFREYLDLQVLVKEKKYVASIIRDPKDIKPKTAQEMFAQAAVTMLVCMLIVVLFRVLFAAVDVLEEEIPMAILNGIDMGLGWALFAGFSVITKAAWEESPLWGLSVQWFNIAVGIVVAAVVISFLFGTAIPLPFKVLLGVIALMGMGSIVAAFVFTIQFWDEAGTGCITAILSVLGKLLLIPIALLAFATNLVTLPSVLLDDDAPGNGQQLPPNVEAPAIPGNPVGGGGGAGARLILPNGAAPVD